MAEAVRRFGTSLIDNPDRCRGVPADLRLEPRAVAALVAAVSGGAAAEVAKPHPPETTAPLVHRLAQRLTDQRAIDPSIAHWAVGAWAHAFEPAATPPPLSPPARAAPGFGLSGPPPTAGPPVSPTPVGPVSPTPGWIQQRTADAYGQPGPAQSPGGPLPGKSPPGQTGPEPRGGPPALADRRHGEAADRAHVEAARQRQGERAAGRLALVAGALFVLGGLTVAGAAYSQRRSIIEVPNLVLGGLVVGLGLAAVVTPPRSRSAAAAATAVALAGPSVLGTFILCWSAVGDRFAC